MSLGLELGLGLSGLVFWGPRTPAKLCTLGLQLARPRFHCFPIKFVLNNDHFGVGVGQI